jgi:hypothetical protein
MIKTVVKLAVAALVVHACWRSANVVLRYSNFKDAVHEMVLFSSAKSDEQLQARVLELAQQFEVPVPPESVKIRRDGNRTIVNAAYTDQIELLPTKFFPWEFKINVETLNAYVPTPNDVTAPGR